MFNVLGTNKGPRAPNTDSMLPSHSPSKVVATVRADNTSGLQCMKWPPLVVQVYRGKAYPWFATALAAIPNQAAMDADKQSFLKSAQDLASGIDNRW